MTRIVFEEKNVRNSLLGLVIALVEVIRDVLRLQAVKRMESGTLRREQCESMGKALMEIDAAIDELKNEYGLRDVIQQVREQLDSLADDVLNLKPFIDAVNQGLSDQVESLDDDMRKPRKTHGSRNCKRGGAHAVGMPSVLQTTR